MNWEDQNFQVAFLKSTRFKGEPYFVTNERNVSIFEVLLITPKVIIFSKNRFGTFQNYIKF